MAVTTAVHCLPLQRHQAGFLRSFRPGCLCTTAPVTAAPPRLRPSQRHVFQILPSVPSLYISLKPQSRDSLPLPCPLPSVVTACWKFLRETIHCLTRRASHPCPQVGTGKPGCHQPPCACGGRGPALPTEVSGQACQVAPGQAMPRAGSGEDRPSASRGRRARRALHALLSVPRS